MDDNQKELWERIEFGAVTGNPPKSGDEKKLDV